MDVSLRRRKLVFVDESSIHQHHVANFGLTFDNTPLKKPSEKGKRIVIGAALSEDGWIGLDGGRRLLFEYNDGTYSAGSVKFWTGNVGGDYHHNFNGENFIEYFQENVLDHLTEPSLMRMDGASYHKIYDENEFFPAKANKKELIEWLDDNSIEFEEGSQK